MATRRRPGLLLLSPHFRVVWADDLLIEQFGLSHDEVLHSDIRTLLRGPLGRVFAHPERFACAVLGSYADQTYLSGRPCHVLPGETRRERRFEYSSRPIYSGKHAGGRVECYLDVTARSRPREEAERPASSSPKQPRATPQSPAPSSAAV